MFIYDDDFLTEDEKSQVEKMFWQPNMPWNIFMSTQNNEVDHAGVVDTMVKDVPYFSTSPIENNNTLSEYIINKFCLKHNIKYEKISRIKFNIQPSVQDQYTLYPHVDTAFDHLVFLYYVSDSDGDTILYNEKFTGEKITTPLTIMKSITPKRGAAFVVNGKHFHSITPPKKTMLRGVINANLAI